MRNLDMNRIIVDYGKNRHTNAGILIFLLSGILITVFILILF